MRDGEGDGVNDRQSTFERRSTEHDMLLFSLEPTRGKMESLRRVGYHDFRAYTEQHASGKYQGFVLVRRHTLVGIVQTVFRAGRATIERTDALAQAEARLAELIRLAAE